jgi:hypothetical protein
MYLNRLVKYWVLRFLYNTFWALVISVILVWLATRLNVRSFEIDITIVCLAVVFIVLATTVQQTDFVSMIREGKIRLNHDELLWLLSDGKEDLFIVEVLSPLEENVVAKFLVYCLPSASINEVKVLFSKQDSSYAIDIPAVEGLEICLNLTNNHNEIVAIKAARMVARNIARHFITMEYIGMVEKEDNIQAVSDVPN